MSTLSRPTISRSSLFLWTLPYLPWPAFAQTLQRRYIVVTNGLTKGDRTGTGTKAVFARQYRHNLADGFPLLTTKKLHFKSIANELIWMLSGNTNIKWLNENGVKIWDEWATEDGDLGPVYGEQWTAWPNSRPPTPWWLPRQCTTSPSPPNNNWLTPTCSGASQRQIRPRARSPKRA